MKLSIAVFAMSAFANSFAMAQDASLMGKYSGYYQSNAGTTINIQLDIKSVEGGVVKGVATSNSTARRGGQCTGDYPVEGTLKDNTLTLRETQKGGPLGDCTFRMTATVEGNKLLAKRGKNEFVMSK